MPNRRKRIDTTKCKELGGGIFYDDSKDVFYSYSKDLDEYIEIESDHISTNME